MRSILFFALLVLVSLNAFSVTENLVKADTVTMTGYSSVKDDLSVVYGGVAGTCGTTSADSTCNSCPNNSTLEACNTARIHSALNFTVSFKSTKDVTGIAKMYVMNSSSVEVSSVSLTSATYTNNSTLATLSTTWASICQAAGMASSCTATSTGIYTAKIGFGIDSDNSSTVDNPSELRIITVTIHYILPGDPASGVSRTYCPTTATGAGVCKLAFEPGDEKAFIKDNLPLSGGVDTSTAIDWESIAIFPIEVTNDGTGDVAAIQNFTTSQISPVFKVMNQTTGNIDDSEVSGGIANYKRYCFIYGNKNKAQNIYQFVAGTSLSSGDAGLVAADICLVPSPNVGILQDKHCFISTAAFGSDMAPEVKTFRKFRNEFLLSNSIGKKFVKYYYKLSPLLANMISQHESLRAAARVGLYPFLVFSYVALNYGILEALLMVFVLFILIFKLKDIVRRKSVLMIFFILLFSPTLKAIEPKTKVMQHPDAAQGLVKITKDGTYIYDEKREFKKESSRISFGQALQPVISIDIEKTDVDGNGTGAFQTFHFEDFYKDASSLIVSYDYEWFPWINKGKLGLQVGGSLMYAQGYGRQLATLEPSREKYTFFTVPLTAGAVYRLEWKDKQLLAPYVAGGGTYTVLLEKREDKAQPQYTGAPGFYAVGGALLNLSVIDSDSGFSLDSEYGISNLWISLEYKIIEVNSDSFDFSNQYVNAGLSFDF
jgi:hypothetical protein